MLVVLQPRNIKDKYQFCLVNKIFNHDFKFGGGTNLTAETSVIRR